MYSFRKDKQNGSSKSSSSSSSRRRRRRRETEEVHEGGDLKRWRMRRAVDMTVNGSKQRGRERQRELQASIGFLTREAIEDAMQFSHLININ